MTVTTKSTQLLAGICLLMVTHVTIGIGQESVTERLETASVHMEQNVTDGDVEVVFEITAADHGLASLVVVSPEDRTVVDFTAPDPSTLGIRQFRFESPEPGDVESLLAAYPEGVYRFTGTTHSGATLLGESRLHHDLPAAVSFIWPAEGDESVSAAQLEITWTPVGNLAAYIIEIDQAERSANITARISGAVAAFPVPDGFLEPGLEYKVGLGTVTPRGNISFVEMSFMTH